MKTSVRATVSTVAAVLLGLAAASPVYAVPVILNGGFEAGFTSWTKADQLGSEGTFFSHWRTRSRSPAAPQGLAARGTTRDGR